MRCGWTGGAFLSDPPALPNLHQIWWPGITRLYFKRKIYWRNDSHLLLILFLSWSSEDRDIKTGREGRLLLQADGTGCFLSDIIPSPPSPLCKYGQPWTRLNILVGKYTEETIAICYSFCLIFLFSWSSEDRDIKNWVQTHHNKFGSTQNKKRGKKTIPVITKYIELHYNKNNAAKGWLEEQKRYNNFLYFFSPSPLSISDLGVDLLWWVSSTSPSENNHVWPGQQKRRMRPVGYPWRKLVTDWMGNSESSKTSAVVWYGDETE